jgi:hypothetical protein
MSRKRVLIITPFTKAIIIEMGLFNFLKETTVVSFQNINTTRMLQCKNK